MAFIVRYTSGIVCTPLPPSEAKRLKLEPMVLNNESPHQTAFTVTIDYKHGTTTGISADDRTATVRALTNGNVQAGDFHRPGHIFPLIAKEGGVLMRSGHTEAAVDLCRLAHLPPVGVICELVNDDGTVMRGAQLEVFAKKHKLHMCSVADLIKHRQQKEKLVEKIGEFSIETTQGKATAHIYKTPFDRVEHLAITFGEIASKTHVRLERENVMRDVFGKNPQLEKSMKILSEKGGILLYLREGATGVATSSLLTSEDHGTQISRDTEWREVGLGAQILRDLGATNITLLSTRERKYVGLEGFGITIEANEII
jgi:3,4-dihydroxy 2-butanone 4-phosphate synthase/GTP cyclohydrolase II